MHCMAGFDLRAWNIRTRALSPLGMSPEKPQDSWPKILAEATEFAYPMHVVTEPPRQKVPREPDRSSGGCEPLSTDCKTLVLAACVHRRRASDELWSGRAGAPCLHNKGGASVLHFRVWILVSETSVALHFPALVVRTTLYGPASLLGSTRWDDI